MHSNDSIFNDGYDTESTVALLMAVLELRLTLPSLLVLLLPSILKKKHAFVSAQRERKKVETLFAEMKNVIGLRRLRLRRMKFVREQFFLAAAAQNVKRLVRFLSQPITPIGEATT